LNKGHIATYNEGLGMVSGDYVVLLSADDLLTPGALQRATDLMAAHPSVGIVYGYPIPLYNESFPRARTHVSSWTIWNGGDWVKLMCRAGKNFINSPEVVMRATVQREIGNYRANLPHSGDMEMWLRAAAVCDIGRVNGADQAYYRVHASSMQRTVHSGFLCDLQGRRDAFQSAFDDVAGQLPDAEQLLELAKRSVAMSAVRHAFLAYDGGRANLEPVEKYCELARSLFPEIVQTRQWRAMEQRRQYQQDAIMTMLYRGRAKVRDVTDYLAWRRWWRTGVL
jgi:hypothetical protein